MENLTVEDYDYFRTKGFDVVKELSGRFYVRPTGEYWRTLADIHALMQEAKLSAIKCGFRFDKEGYILGYEKPE